MIEFTKSYRVGDKVFATIEEAQAQELNNLFDANKGGMVDDDSLKSAQARFVKVITQNADSIINILSTSASSRPKARIANGRKPRKLKATAQPEPQPTPA